MSSLSHSRTVRPSMAALVTTASSTSGPRVMTKPPTWVATWRGKSRISSVSSSAMARRGSLGVEPLGRGQRRQPHLVARAPAGLGQPCRDVLREAHGLADLADGAAGAVADDGGADRRPLAAVAVVDVLDHLLAALVLEVDVDVGRLAAAGRDEALEQQVVLGRVHRGDAQHVADRRVGGRAAALAEDALSPREADDLVHRQEVGRVAQLARSAAARGRSARRFGRRAARPARGRAAATRVGQGLCGERPGSSISSGYS